MKLVDIIDVKQALMEKCDLYDEESIQSIIDEIPTTECGLKPIEEVKPIVGLRVLCQWEKRNGIDKEIYITIMHRNANDEWISEFGVCTGKVTHWMELPFTR